MKTQLFDKKNIWSQTKFMEGHIRSLLCIKINFFSNISSFCNLTLPKLKMNDNIKKKIVLMAKKYKLKGHQRSLILLNLSKNDNIIKTTYF